MTDTPRLLRYTKLGSQELVDGVLWVAIISGSPGKGGEGVVIHGHGKALYAAAGPKIADERTPGVAFTFSASTHFSTKNSPFGPVEREVWGVDAAPVEVQAAWMKFKTQGKLG